MRVGVPQETGADERRVAATPDTAGELMSLGFAVAVARGAGTAAGFPDALYVQAGCVLVDEADAWSAPLVIKIAPPTLDEVARLSPGATLISFIWPAQRPELLEALAAREVTTFALDAVPRITRAQKLDALSSMANLAGHRAVIEAAHAFGRLFTGQVTAAGKMPPARVLVIGAGVAGLAAIGAARSLGAIVRAFDTRPAVQEQVESMGAEFLTLDFEEDGAGEGGYARVMSPAFIAAEMALFAAQAPETDLLITTALIPGEPAPELIDRETVERMQPGSVIVDLAAQSGGNCALTVPGELIEHQGVKIIGYTDLLSRMARQASQLIGTNIYHLLDELRPDDAVEAEAALDVDEDDEVIRGALVTRRGAVTWPPPERPPPEPPAPAAAPDAPDAPPPAMVAPETPPTRRAHQAPQPASRSNLWLALCGLLLLGVGYAAPPAFLGHLTVFVLACFTGWLVIWSVKPALHTPLMSVTNAISGIIMIAGMVQLTTPSLSAATMLGGAAILVATINVAGGFLVTQRMLNMFRR